MDFLGSIFTKVKVGEIWEDDVMFSSEKIKIIEIKGDLIKYQRVFYDFTPKDNRFSYSTQYDITSMYHKIWEE